MDINLIIISVRTTAIKKTNNARAKIESSVTSIKNFLIEIKEDAIFTKESLIKQKSILKAQLPGEIDSLKRTIKTMKNIIFIFFIYAALIILTTSKTDNYDKDFIKNFLVNANSSILDFLILGVILYYFEHKRQNKEAIKELIEDLGNLAKHSSAELNIMKLKIMRQLISKGVLDIKVPRIELNGLTSIKNLDFKQADLSSINMSESYIKKCSFTNCNLSAMNIKGSTLREVKFINCEIKNIKAIKANFKNVKFENCNFEGGFFSDSEMKSCQLQECNFKLVTFTGANMRSANLRNATNINTSHIADAKSIDYIICDQNIENELKNMNLGIKFSRGRNRG
ncbi:hypothetical protein EC036_25130 [Enterobacter cloacae]|uniref:pentapeptide repeat-containing protein n=1 Tax=Enterobacter cloacae TaxID=550 RepID=UPI00052A583A|nr:pentapeptide repeat-containing protein [Enterobacter cloacae]AIV30160.1 hypothetical protein EC036_25130 [Enterobacter cloacae]